MFMITKGINMKLTKEDAEILTELTAKEIPDVNWQNLFEEWLESDYNEGDEIDEEIFSEFLVNLDILKTLYDNARMIGNYLTNKHVKEIESNR